MEEKSVQSSGVGMGKVARGTSDKKRGQSLRYKNSQIQFTEIDSQIHWALKNLVESPDLFPPPKKKKGEF